MILDRELYFTATTGQLFDAANTASEYGANPVLVGPADTGAGEKLVALYKVVDANSDVGTSLAFKVVTDDDGAGTNEVVLLTKTVLVAALTTAAGVVRIGTIDPGTRKKYLRIKVTTAGNAATAGLIAVWLQPGDDSTPANDGRVI